jgi:hypothetical protein
MSGQNSPQSDEYAEFHPLEGLPIIGSNTAVAATGAKINTHVAGARRDRVAQIRYSSLLVRAALGALALRHRRIFPEVIIDPRRVRRRSLEEVVDRIFTENLADRVLPFDSAAAHEFAELAASRRRAGQPIAEADARIAAISRSRDAALATRNVGDFVGCGLELINPWA